jgi:tRNA (cytosine38-C5)-methyltransferase
MILFEFFSGIGGMHQALSMVKDIKIQKVYAFDINPNANTTYAHNFGIKPKDISLESLTLKDYETMCSENKANNNIIWLMSPPCQPFTRQGKCEDLKDERTNGFKNLMNILIETKYTPEYFLLENVKGFEVSDAWCIVEKVLLAREFRYRHFLLSPNQMGIPNSRLRYYLMARGKNQPDFKDLDGDGIIDTPEIFLKYGIIDDTKAPSLKVFFSGVDIGTVSKDYYLTESLLSKESSQVIDLVTYESNNTNCFTKGYGRLLKGTGSILLEDDNLVDVIIM